MAEESARHFAEQRFHNIEPGTVGGSVNIFETIRPCDQKGSGLLRNVGRVIVQNEPNRVVGRIVSVQVLQQDDKLPATMTPFDVRRHMTGMKVEGRQDGTSSESFILVVRARVGWRPGTGGRSGAVVARACTPGFSSTETVMTFGSGSAVGCAL